MVKTERKGREEKQPYHHGDLKAALMKAALLLIDRHGIKGFSLKDAAALAGVSTAAPYRHFADKDALLRVIQSEGFALFDASLTLAFERADTALVRITEMGVAYVRFAMEHPAHFKVMFSLSDNDEGGPGGGSKNGFMLLVEAVAALYPNATPETRNDLAVMCWSIVHGFAVLQMDGAFDATLSTGGAEGQLRRALGLLFDRTT
jgi:AcrR family transcriptional regulator